jgi:serine protease inhibitor
MRSSRILSAALPAVLVAACSGDDVSGPLIDRLPRQLTLSEQKVIRSSNSFGFDLFARAHSLASSPNVFLSPLSASMALGMTMNGADGGTWEAMRFALRFGDLAETQINESYRGLIDLLLDLDRRVTVRIGNSVWSGQGVPFEPAFFQRVSEYFDGEARELNFNDPSSVDVINRWASDATNGRIDKVLDRIDPEQIMFLMNALYFKGTWEQQFDRSRTRQQPFTRPDGSQVNVPMMSAPGRQLLFTSIGDYQAIELAYGGGAYAMVIVLPAQGRTLSQLVASLDAEAWDTLIAGLDSAKLDVQMPRFRLKYEDLLNQPLTDMGMGVAFGSDANFTRLTPLARTNPVCIQFVKQNTFLEVNEEGTEAAAVTTVGIGLTSLPPWFVADRPFLFVIRERLSGTVLFIGAIGDPTSEDSPKVQIPPPQC